MPCGVYLPPSKDVPMVAPKTRNPRTYAYFSIPKIFAQNIDKDNKVSPITQIHAIKASTTTLHGKSRYVCACMLVLPHHITSHHNITQPNTSHPILHTHTHSTACNRHFYGFICFPISSNLADTHIRLNTIIDMSTIHFSLHHEIDTKKNQNCPRPKNTAEI